MNFDEKVNNKVCEFLNLDDVARQSVQFKLHLNYDRITHEIFSNGSGNWVDEKYAVNLKGYSFQYLVDFVKQYLNKNPNIFEDYMEGYMDEFMSDLALCKNADDIFSLIGRFQLDDYDNSIWKMLGFSKCKTTQAELDSASLWDEDLNWLIEWLTNHPLKKWNHNFLKKLRNSFETLRPTIPIGVIDYDSNKEWYRQNKKREVFGDGDIEFADEVIFTWIYENPDLIDLNGKSLGMNVKEIYTSKGSSLDDNWIINLKRWEKENNIVDKKSAFTNTYVFPENSKDIISITELDLSEYKLSKLPKELFNLINLTKLDLSKNNLTEIPKEIGNLKNLTSLNLMRNNLTEIPKEIGDLTNLKSLILYSNKLTHLPNEIGNLVNLTKLILRFNKISEMPEEIKKLTKLTFFDTD